ncbi:hypothetical protein ACIBMX_48655 [Streptomyces phaeochromogenes]|uniref:hypothetical protein n=1 Tax=Streptomyces phaeochromogenes TaxID=1923 RepID=UPI0033F26A30
MDPVTVSVVNGIVKVAQRRLNADVEIARITEAGQTDRIRCTTAQDFHHGRSQPAGTEVAAMEDALSTDIDLADHVETHAAPLPGIELAEALHYKQYPALVRFLLLHGASWAEAQDAAQDAFTQMCAPGLSLTHPRAWLRTVAWRSWVSQQVKPEDARAEMPEPPTDLRWQTPDHAAELEVEIPSRDPASLPAATGPSTWPRVSGPLSAPSRISVTS